MSKIYDALMKAQREQATQRKATIPSEPLPEPKVVEAEKQTDQPTPLLGARPEIGFQKPTVEPLVPRKGITRVPVGRFIAGPNSVMAEQFRKLRSVITTHNLTSSLRSVLLTSCMPGEGKTKVSINLAAAIAKGPDDSVILIDADLRKKSMSGMLGLRDTLGLSDILAGRAGIHEIFVGTDIKSLTILPAGSNRPNPSELIGSTRMRSLIQHLRESYSNSYILIDSTPIVSTSEASTLSRIVDGVIVIIMADKTRRDLVKRELNTLDSDKILGVVLNCAEFETPDYYHKYYPAT
jgi:capsular exopolysaccharide synthesis family protein